MKKFSFASLLSIGLSPIILRAQNSQSVPDTLFTESYSGMAGLGKLFLFFLLIIALFILFIYLIKKFRNFKFGKSLPSDDIKVVHTLYIDQKKKILFLKMFAEIYVLGCSENNINLITKLTDADIMEKFSSETKNPSKQVRSKFQQILSRTK